MTNREWLQTLSDYDMARFIVNEPLLIAAGKDHSVTKITEWLKQEHPVPETRETKREEKNIYP